VASLIATITLICYVLPRFATVLIPVSVVYLLLQKSFVNTSRQLKRVRSIARSPIFSHFSESLKGVSTIRAYKREDVFIHESDGKVNKFYRIWYTVLILNRWLATRIEILSAIIVLVIAIFAVTSRGSITPGLAGLSLSYALDMTTSLTWFIRMMTDLESNIVSLERIMEYAGNEEEAPWHREHDNALNPNWPARGDIQFRVSHHF